MQIGNKAGAAEDLLNLAIEEWVKDGVDSHLAQGVSKFEIPSVCRNTTKKARLIMPFEGFLPPHTY